MFDVRKNIDAKLQHRQCTARLRSFLVMNGLSHAAPRVLARELGAPDLHNDIVLNTLYAKVRPVKRKLLRAKCHLE